MIYFIQEGKDGSIKIGFTKNDVRKRLSNLQSGSCRELRLLCVIDGDCQKEQRIHNTFYSIKDRGEWFYPYPHLTEYIKSLISSL